MRILGPVIAFASLFVLPTSRLAAQSAKEGEAIASWVAVDMATGYETRLAPALAADMSGWTVDHWGNLVSTVGSGAPRRVLACALDRPSLTVSQITEDGYLRVHRIGSGSRHPLWDQAWEAQPVRILTQGGPVTGVVARSNGHFAAQHRAETAIVSADDLWVDVGAESAGGVAALGIGLLDPIARELPAWSFAGQVAGPDAGRRGGCAAVAALAQAARDGNAPEGETRFVMSGGEVLGWVGLSSAIARGGALEGVVILAPGESEGSVESRPASSFGRMGPVLEAAGVGQVSFIVPQVRSPGSQMEILSVDEAGRVLAAAAEAVGMRTSGVRWVAAPPPAPPRINQADPSLDKVASLLDQLVERYAVPGHEWSVRRLVLESLPAWARERAVVDDMGDIMVEAGPERDTTVFMAHMDEVSYEVESIAPDGVVTLATRGGAVSSAWEGQTALLHFDPEGAPSLKTGSGDDTNPRWKRESLAADAPPPLKGVFLTRDDAEGKDPGRRLKAWFGLDAQELAGRGVAVGSGVTSYKEGRRMGVNRFVARSLDDRAGTTALILAVQGIDPDALTSKVIFTWSVGEEGGLVGAGAMARRYGVSTTRIYSVDTFVSSDTPLESPHFAFAPLGAGPVLRAIENSGVSPDRERARVGAAASKTGIPLQMGLTQGGTDGGRFAFFGAPNQGLSWPGRYSHSPGEVLDLRDLRNLGRLIRAVATLEP